MVSWLHPSVIPSRVEGDSSLGPQTWDLKAPSLNEAATWTNLGMNGGNHLLLTQTGSQVLWKQCVGHRQSDSLLCAWPSDSTGDEEQVGLTFIEHLQCSRHSTSSYLSLMPTL